MNQVLYIDAEEEVSSIIEKIAKSKCQDNFLVVPQRAIILQSGVNLKLLKREIDKIGKRMVIITQDDIGISLAARAGIQTRRSTEGIIENDEENSGTDSAHNSIENDWNEAVRQENLVENKILQIKQDKKKRLSGVGSVDFYEVSGGAKRRVSKEGVLADNYNAVFPENLHARANESAEKVGVPVSYAQRSAGSMQNIAETKKSVEAVKKPVKKILQRSESGYPDLELGRINAALKRVEPGELKKDALKLSPEKEEVFEKMFSARRKKDVKEEAQEESHAIRKAFTFFASLSVFILLGVVAYLFYPSSKIILNVNPESIKKDFQLSGSLSGENSDLQNIKIEQVSLAVTKTYRYEVQGVGSKITIGKKAQGKIIIYNEYSGEPQALVATTRFRTEEGKIFRLTKNIVVPGMKDSGDSTQAGSVEADVIADQAGSDYNIQPAEFKIPGFEGGAKYDKFYAKSSFTMNGGTTEGEKEAVITKDDLAAAKEKSEVSAKTDIMEDVNAKIDSDSVLLPQAQNISILSSVADAKIGDAKSNFSYSIEIEFRGLVFSNQSIKDLIIESYQENAQWRNIAVDTVEYDPADVDFNLGTLKTRAHADVNIEPDVDAEKIKDSILGETEDELIATLKNYKAIKNISVSFYPSFLPKVSKFPSRVEVEVVKGD